MLAPFFELIAAASKIRNPVAALAREQRDRYRSREPDQDGLVRIMGAISAKGRKSRSAKSGTRLFFRSYAANPAMHAKASSS